MSAYGSRFWSNIAKTENEQECWLWTGYIRSGNPRYRIAGKSHIPHVYAFEMHQRRPLNTKNYKLQRSCANEFCCNYNHYIALPKALPKAAKKEGEK